MSASPQQAIRKYLTNNASRVFSQAKKDLKKQAERRILELKSKVPTKEEIKSQFITGACSERAQNK